MTNNDYFVISLEKKKKIIAILLYVIAIIIFLSLVSYSPADNSTLISDSKKEITNLAYNTPETQKRIDEISNWLGITGAYISYFLINYLLGIWSIAFPLIIGTFAYFIYKNQDYKLPFYFSNVYLIFGIIFATFFGLINSKFNIFTTKYLFGNVGANLGYFAKLYLGFAGSLIILITIFAITLIIAFNIKFKFIVRSFKQLFEKIKNLFIKIEPVQPAQVNKEIDTIQRIKNIPKPSSPKPTIDLQIFEGEKVILPFEEDEPNESIPPFIEAEMVTSPEVNILNDDATENPPLNNISEEDKSNLEVNNTPQKDIPNANKKIIIGDLHSNNEFQVPEQIDNSKKSSFKISDKSLLENLNNIDDNLILNDEIKESSTPKSNNQNNALSLEQEKIVENDSNLAKLSQNNLEQSSDINNPQIAQSFVNEEETATLNPTEELTIQEKSNLGNKFNPKTEDDFNEPSHNLNPVKDELGILPEPWEEEIEYTMPDIDILNPIPPSTNKISKEELYKNAELLKNKLSLFGIKIQKIDVKPGPVITMYEIVPEPGVKISKILGLENDIAMALAAKGIRIIAPIPGKSAIGVEIPNNAPQTIYAREVIQELQTDKYKNFQLPLALGKTITGEIYITDLATIPHLLIAGATGAGKSVGMNMILTSLLYSKHPKDVKFAIIDPKKVEMSVYRSLSHHYLAISPEIDEDIVTNSTNAVKLLKALVQEMDMRYNMLANAGVRHINEYNKKIQTNQKYALKNDIKHHYLPYIVVIIDELADLMITSGKEVEEPITRLAQLARAVGIHLVIATQRPSVNVITGLIKANFSARIAYQVASKIDSRTILDMNGAEQLIGKGDMLYLPNGTPKPIRLQNAFISTDEVEKLVKFISKQNGFSKKYLLPKVEDEKENNGATLLEDLDPLFEEAAKIVVETQQASTSFLQRKLKLGYSRAARIMDQLEMAGIIGQSDGGRGREIIIKNLDELDIILRTL